ncbi:MAG: hypothetical protein ACTS6G_02635 [Candidatus Hodgkinia cicadicola]
MIKSKAYITVPLNVILPLQPPTNVQTPLSQRPITSVWTVQFGLFRHCPQSAFDDVKTIMYAFGTRAIKR